MAAEGDLRKKLKARVKSYGGEIRAVSWLGRRHAPDVLCLFPHACEAAILATCRGETRSYEGYNEFVETKAPKQGPTRGQHAEHNRMRGAGCRVRVISTEAQLDAWLPPL